MQNRSNVKTRDSFVFYRSFFEAAKTLEKEQKAEVFEAICAYALDGTETELRGVSKGFFALIKPQLDANWKKFENGCKEKQNRSKTEAKQKQNRSKTEGNVNVNVNVNDNVNDIKKTKEKKESELPNFISKKNWEDFEEMRKKIKKPLLESAKDLIIKKLIEFESKKAGSANKALENSIEGSWQGVFEPKPDIPPRQASAPPYNNFKNNDYTAPEGFNT